MFFKANSLTLLTLGAFISYIFISLFLIKGITLYRVRHVRLCIQSADPTRLQSQCVYCRNRIFPLTVRVCTSNNYLPARMSVNEGYCLVNACRRQLPKLPLEPYRDSGNQATAVVGPQAILTPSSVDQQLQILPNGNGLPMVVNSPNALSANVPPGSVIEPANTENGNDYEETAESMQTNSKTRPPARFFVGKPQKMTFFKIRPSFFG